MPRFASAEDALKGLEERLASPDDSRGLNEVDLSIVAPEGRHFSTTGVMELTFAGFSLGIEDHLKAVVIKVNVLHLASEATRMALQKWLQVVFSDGCTVEIPELIDSPRSSPLHTTATLEILDEHTLDLFLLRRQGLLTTGELDLVISSIPSHLRETNQAKYLAAVGFYDAQHKKSANKDWAACILAFEKILPTPHNHLDFDVPNYLFLACRNAGRDFWGRLPDLFQQAKSAAEAKEDPEIKAQLLGFILYNYARHLLQNERKTDEAMRHYIEAGRARVQYFMALRSRGVSAEDSMMKGAATQVWKIREDWPAFFGEATLAECPVTEDLFRLLEEQYGVNPRFSATRA